MRTITKISLALAATTAATLTATPAVAATPEGVVATVRVTNMWGPAPGYQDFRVHLIEEEDIKAAQAALDEPDSDIVEGALIFGDPEYNKGYNWHVDPKDVAIDQFSTTVCYSGPPAGVETLPSKPERYCPQDAFIIDIVDAY